ncbi:hypothetical protein LXL04_000266 [Taraxacum kok-saghyz]
MSSLPKPFHLHRPKPLSPEDGEYNKKIGAVLVKNEYNKKMFFKTIVLSNNVTFTCESWVASKFDNPDKRIFFTDKSYLPSKTPEAPETIDTKHESVIQLVTEWPLKSKLDPEVYGPPESPITKEIVEQEIKGFMTLEENLTLSGAFLRLSNANISIQSISCKVHVLQQQLLFDLNQECRFMGGGF